MNLTNFGEKILRSRQNAGLTQEELALRIGVTPQAVSRWERNQSMPDILLFSDLCRVLNVSADSLLDTVHGNITGEYDSQVQEEIFENLNRCNEPLEILIGIDLAYVWENGRCTAWVAEQRKLLSQEGFLLPIVRIRDDCRLRSREFMITAFRRVLHDEDIETVDENTWESMIQTLGNVARAHYDRILNRDIVKLLTDNLKQEYPTLIESTVPQKISYGLLTDVLKLFVRHKNSPVYLPQIIEIIDSRLREHPNATAEELTSFAEKELIGEDNLDILLAERSSL
ncbi:MAG: helix-turn-helix domain-containing protein [Lachnospiraceae bacterium]|nr:helix-turn-helix domain-containing protein [Lachnospiraceae bacterium]